MKRIVAAVLAGLAAPEAFAHDALVPHSHPHGVSVLPGLDLLIVAILLAGLAFVLVGKLRRAARPAQVRRRRRRGQEVP